DATSISLKEIGRNIPNTPMIGALIKATDIMKLEVVLEDFKNKYSGKFKQEVIDGNLKAIQRAYDEVKSE
ncbi:MAG: 2-oxoacid:acceptor oxidoreductase family protein, partial [Candidatus Omnitrophica bacterium]|nr:2-oxoacid:acceptor oxidoreductase family protein [Candidatus Omnitrophota bacterium]